MFTRSLQQSAPELYKELFKRCPVVVSVARAFNWCGERAVAWGGLQVRQKLPWRTYLGLEPIEGGGLRFGLRKVYFPAKRKFVDYEFPRRWQENIASNVKKYIENVFGAKSQGFVLHVITEGPAGRSVGDSHALSTALAAALALQYRLISADEVLQWADLKPHALSQSPALRFGEILKFAIALPIASDPPFVHSGGGPFTSLTWGDDPQVFAWGKTSPELERLFERAAHDELTLKVASDFSGWSFRELMRDLTPVAPLDYSLIFLGQASVGGMARLVRINIEENVIEVARGINRLFSLHALAQSLPFYRFSQAVPDEQHNIKMVTSFLTLAVTTRLAELYRKGHKPLILAKFLDEYQHYCNWMRMLRGAPANFAVTERLAQVLAEERGSRVILQPFASGGDVLVVSEPGVQQGLIKGLGAALRKQRIPFELDYASWRDGNSKEGLKVEQFLEKGIMSSFISSGLKALRSRDQDGQERKIFLSTEEFARKRSSFDVLVDAKESRIYVRGRALSSKELHSTKTTIKILRTLDAHFGKEVSASALPPSSYIDRNEMQSKIVSPLMQIVKKRLGKHLPLTITGGPAKNFTMRLDAGEVKIYWLE